MCIAGFASRRPIYAKPKGERTKITVSLATTVISYLALCNALKTRVIPRKALDRANPGHLRTETVICAAKWTRKL